jgi:hypothetical protein
LGVFEVSPAHIDVSFAFRAQPPVRLLVLGLAAECRVPADDTMRETITLQAQAKARAGGFESGIC